MDRRNCTDTINGAALSSALPLSWHGWFEDGKALLVAELKRVMATMLQYRRRARTRRQLLALDEHLRLDIGLSAAQIQREAEKPFWKE